MSKVWKLNKAGLVCLVLATSATGKAPGLAQAPMPALSRDDYDEVQIGRRDAARVEQDAGGVLPFDHPMSRRVRAIGYQFARLSVRRNIPYTFKVLSDDRNFKALALRGGPVYISRAMVNETSNDAELASILGHEVAHIDRRHLVVREKKQQRNQLLATLLAELAGGRKPDDARLGANFLAGLGYEVWKGRYSRKDENEADRIAVRWMSQLGYDPRAAHTMLGKLDEIDARMRQGKPRGLLGIGEDHAPPRDRQEKVLSLINQRRLVEVARGGGGPRLDLAIRYPPQAYFSTGGYRPPPDVYFFTAPVLAQNGDRGRLELMVPTAEFARWAGAQVGRSSDGDVLVLRRGDVEVALPRDSSLVYVNGRAFRMHARSRNYNGLAYAPFDELAGAFDAQYEVVREEGVFGLAVLLPGRPIGFFPGH